MHIFRPTQGIVGLLNSFGGNPNNILLVFILAYSTSIVIRLDPRNVGGFVGAAKPVYFELA